ncbi:MAG: ATP-binding protein [Bacteroidales bacterium]
MKRDKIKELIEWKTGSGRKPLVVRGARQVGKTWLLREFGKDEYENCVYINFEDANTIKDIFVQDFDIERIILSLEIYSKEKITADKTLIIFDEIQETPRAITSLKYFYEKAPEYHIIAAGSLLGMGLHKNISFPVGKVNFMNLRPLSFCEFLGALGEDLLAESITKCNWDLLNPFTDKLINYLKTYYYVGGMPEVVNAYVETKDFSLVRNKQMDILRSYVADFSKHAPSNVVARINMVWQSIPSQLAKENKKFIYGVIREGARAKDFELAIQWLCDTGILIKSNRISKPHIPLIAYEEGSIFKLFLLDVGLLSAICHLDVTILLEKSKIFTEFKGALTEQFVLQELRNNEENYIGYWTNDKNTAEVDFVIQSNNRVIPIEVKAEVNVRSKSFKLFYDKYQPEYAVRSSMLPYSKESWLDNIPLYGVSTIK